MHNQLHARRHARVRQPRQTATRFVKKNDLYEDCVCVRGTALSRRGARKLRNIILGTHQVEPNSSRVTDRKQCSVWLAGNVRIGYTERASGLIEMCLQLIKLVGVFSAAKFAVFEH